MSSEIATAASELSNLCFEDIQDENSDSNENVESFNGNLAYKENPAANLKVSVKDLSVTSSDITPNAESDSQYAILSTSNASSTETVDNIDQVSENNDSVKSQIVCEEFSSVQLSQQVLSDIVESYKSVFPNIDTFSCESTDSKGSNLLKAVSFEDPQLKHLEEEVTAQIEQETNKSVDPNNEENENLVCDNGIVKNLGYVDISLGVDCISEEGKNSFPSDSVDLANTIDLTHASKTNLNLKENEVENTNSCFTKVFKPDNDIDTQKKSECDNNHIYKSLVNPTKIIECHTFRNKSMSASDSSFSDQHLSEYEISNNAVALPLTNNIAVTGYKQLPESLDQFPPTALNSVAPTRCTVTDAAKFSHPAVATHAFTSGPPPHLSISGGGVPLYHHTLPITTPPPPLTPPRVPIAIPPPPLPEHCSDVPDSVRGLLHAILSLQSPDDLQVHCYAAHLKSITREDHYK